MAETWTRLNNNSHAELAVINLADSCEKVNVLDREPVLDVDNGECENRNLSFSQLRSPPMQFSQQTVLIGVSLQFVLATVLHADDLAVDLTPGEVEVRKHLSIDQYDVTTIRLWPGTAPDEPRPIPAESVKDGKRSRIIKNVTQPSITVARLKQTANPTPAILICPGGGYGSLGITVGGVDMIDWLRSRGVTGVYVKYRVPKRHRGFAKHHHAVQDLQRAVSLLRSRAIELNIDPNRIGVLGFSAGGHVAAMLATNHQQQHRLYEATDEIDQISCRPDFVAMVAPAYLTKPMHSDKIDPALKPDAIARNVTPPTFIASAINDKFTVGSLHFLLTLRKKRVPAEVHIYEKGGHAEGIHDGPDNQWADMFEDWLRRRSLIE